MLVEKPELTGSLKQSFMDRARRGSRAGNLNIIRYGSLDATHENVTSVPTSTKSGARILSKSGRPSGKYTQEVRHEGSNLDYVDQKFSTLSREV